MSEAQEENTNTLKATVGNILGSWKVKAGLIAAVVVSIAVGLFLLTFFWSHLVALQGMKSWSSQAGAREIECMIKDTNSDGYVSCSAMLEGEIVPLECGASVFNIGCRVNYGAAASPLLRPTPQSHLPKGGGS